MKYISLILLVAVLSVPGMSQDQTIPDNRWNLVMQYLALQKDFSGAIIMGANGKIKVNYGSGYADRASRLPFTDQTLYTIGSITKSFTATAILLLMDQGKINLSDPLSIYFENVPADKKHITLHQLLTHSAGLPGAIGDDYEPLFTADFQKRTWQQPLLFNPGTGYAYSNVGYTLLGMIIEKVSTQSYSTFIRDNIFTPAGMKTAGYKNPDTDYRFLAHGYNPDGSDWGTSHDKNWNGPEPYWNLKANGGILMCAQDMYQWYMALRENTVLKPELLKLQTTPYADEGQGSYYGYGYAVDQDGECVQHNGGNRIFKADFRWFPKADFFLFSATNDANVRLFRLNDEIIRILKTGELPVAESWKEVPSDSFPADADQFTAKALIDLLRSYSYEKADLFIPEYCTAQMIERNGKERLRELFNMLHEDADTASRHTVFTSGQKVQIVMKKKDENAHLKIILSMVEHKIDRLGAEIEGM